MRRLAIAISMALGIIGCSQPSATDSKTVDPDNTGVNVRDRNAEAKTPTDQKENQSDIDITADIRKRIVDADLSVNAQNVKVITADGGVTLRGPVESAEEKEQIEDIARAVAGADKVTSQLEVE